MSAIIEIEINAIKAVNRIREADNSKVESLADSISKLGLMNPISVHPDHSLIAGLHRLEACRKLGWSTIPAIVLDYQAQYAEQAALYAELAEIDENLIRNDLTELQQGIQHNRRKRIYEALHPETKRGALGGKGINADILTENIAVRKEGYAENAAQSIGVTERTVHNKTRIGEQLESVAEQLIGTAIEDNQSELLALASLQESKPDVAAVVIQKLVEERDKPAPQPIPVAPVAAPSKTGSKKKKPSTPKSPKPKTSVKKIVAEIKKKERIADIEQQAAAIEESLPGIPVGPFHVISIDPPWPYGTGYDPDGRRAANPYPEMSLEQIKAIELPAADDCVLWLWTTHKFMRHSFELLDAWGFRDVAILTWVKGRMGLGSWLRSQSEFCIMAVKGKPPIQLTNQITIIDGPLREHSRKPDSFYELVNGLCVGAKLDYFSREKREGWAQVGNTTELFGEAV
jgi:N6-adenosine-specific RNA methylase IME4/ParB-like chromosome segregation protein Spo0J